MSLAVALGVGLLIGTERERRKQERPSPSTAGIRTFAVATLAGAISLMVGGVALLAITTTSIAVLAALGYWRAQRESDPGVTTEIALILAVLVGALAVLQPMVAAAVGVIVAILLAARTPLHHFVSNTLTADEVRDALILAGASLVVLPLLPDRAMGPLRCVQPALDMAGRHSPAGDQRGGPASLSAAGHIEPRGGVLPILAGPTTNTVTKIVLALSGGQREFAWRVIPGLVLVAGAAWLGAFLRAATRG